MEKDDLFDGLNEAVKDPINRTEELIVGIRGLSRHVISVISSKREEQIYPVYKEFSYLYRVLKRKWDYQSENARISYLLGKVDGVLELLSISMDSSLSEKVIEEAQKPPFRDILEHLVSQVPREVGLSELELAIKLDRENLENAINWMGSNYLVRTVRPIESKVYVSLGPKGQATFEALPLPSLTIIPFDSG